MIASPSVYQKKEKLKKFNELHFFIDESGNLTAKSPKKEIMLVGGVLLFGTYDEEADNSLKKIITNELTKVGGKFPGDLHFSKTSLLSKEKDKFIENLTDSIKKWTNDNRQLYGVFINHVKDIYSFAPILLTERELDNRYLSMLWSLVEYLVFVDDNVKNILMDNANIHLHIAGRVFTLNRNRFKKKKTELESLGYEMRKSTFNRGEYFTKSLKTREVAGMVRMALRQRWNHSKLKFSSIDTSSIQYDREKYKYLDHLQISWS